MSVPTAEVLNVSRETFARFQTYAALLEKWNPRINLVSRSTLGDLWTRHIADSAQIYALAPEGIQHWVDLGSGGGFPGLVVAMIAAEAAPQMRVTLVESDTRKAAFLATVARETGLATRIVSERIEAIAPLEGDVVSARALAALDPLLGLAHRHMAPGAVGLFPKGAGFRAEVAAALASWRFDLQKHPSATDAQAVILEVRGVSRV